MAITVNTNMSSIIVQQNLNKATTGMNTAMERMSTGLRINSSADDAAGMAVATKLDYKVGSLAVAQDNGQMGASLLDTAEGVLNVMNSNLTRIRDLTEQAANGTYGSDALEAIATEVSARLDEITRVAQTTEFNGINLLSGTQTTAINLQVGIGTTTNDIIALDSKLFANAKASALLGSYTPSGGSAITDYTADNVKLVYASDAKARGFLTNIDAAIKNVTDRKTLIGGNQQRIISAMETAQVMQTNLTSASSLIKDADIAEESSNYIKNQILQQASATLLATANQSPSIAVNLV